MEENEKLKTGIGNQESEKLKESLIVVQGVKIQGVEKNGQQIGEKVVLLCKHPDREDLLEISKVKYLKNDKVESSGTWFNLDSDKKIVKASALASLMKYYGCESLNDFAGKQLQTVLDGDYLVVKAY